MRSAGEPNLEGLSHFPSTQLLPSPVGALVPGGALLQPISLALGKLLRPQGAPKTAGSQGRREHPGNSCGALCTS